MKEGEVRCLRGEMPFMVAKDFDEMFRGTVEEFREPYFVVGFDDGDEEEWEVHEVQEGIRGFEKVREGEGEEVESEEEWEGEKVTHVDYSFDSDFDLEAFYALV